MKTEKFYYGECLSYGKLEVLVLRKQVIATGNLLENKCLPRVTVCAILDRDAKTLSFGVARCSRTDNFNKKIGRELSRKRALDNPYKVVKITPETRISELFLQTSKEIENEVMHMQYPIKF